MRVSASDLFPKIRHKVDGWFSRTDIEIFAALLNGQTDLGWTGSVVEIGTHHGKSFIPLALSNDGNKAYVIDIFDDQDKNIDKSGKGDRARFLDNLKSLNVPTDHITIDARLSSDVSAADILNSVGTARFFHIDGGHHLQAVESDLDLAVAVSAEHGIICVDDVFRPEWPEVSMGVFGSRALNDVGFRLFAYGFNKGYWCHENHLESYQTQLLKTPFLKMALAKTYQGTQNQILTFARSPRPEWRLRNIISWNLQTFRPSTAFAVFKLLKKSA